MVLVRLILGNFGQVLIMSFVAGIISSIYSHVEKKMMAIIALVEIELVAG